MKSKLPRALVLALLGAAMVVGQLVLGASAVVAQAADDEGPLMQRLRELRRPDGSVDAPYGTGQPEELAIQTAYEQYLAVTVDALARTDASRMEEVAAGRRLERTRAYINQLQASGRLAEVTVESIAPVAYVELTGTEAIIYVQYRQWHREIDAVTGALMAEQAGEILDTYYLLERSDAAWKVTDSA
ncbi:MAG: hypothetical protein IT306_10410 [Chloroflexi bacterium]|nr:hypothetical protein [Chloroflexota bacterium]